MSNRWTENFEALILTPSLIPGNLMTELVALWMNIKREDSFVLLCWCDEDDVILCNIANRNMADMIHWIVTQFSFLIQWLNTLISIVFFFLYYSPQFSVEREDDEEKER